VALFGWASGAGAQTITEFALPINTGPVAITTGSDGALWFVPPESNKIGRITTGGSITDYTCPNPCGANPSSFSLGITGGPDGALWFTDGNGQIGRITTSGAVTKYPLPSSLRVPTGITAGPDGALWFTEFNDNRIGRITTSGAITEFPIPTTRSSNPVGITAGPDGALWFAESASSKIGRITISGMITEYAIPTLGALLLGITTGPDGALWFTESIGLKIGRITTSGAITEYPIPPESGSVFFQVDDIAAGPDGALWFTEPDTNKIGRITTSGSVAQYPLSPGSILRSGIAAGPDGAMWFTEESAIGRITTGNASGLVAAVLPSSRSVQVGNTATAFATIINSGSSAVSGCAITPVTTVPASFVYQTTDPKTNALTRSPNTPASIAAGGSQSFVIAFTPNAPFVPTNVVLGFACTGVSAAPSTTGLNTVLLSASATPVPDIVALAATASNDGILHITGTNGSNAFAVATVNIGASASITATANTGAVSLPPAISLCQTNPASGQCTSSVGPSVTTTINAGATPTFAIFATASGQVAFDPANNRIFVIFSDAGGTVRGLTSVAVQTQ
jgi:streptogramin lyase